MLTAREDDDLVVFYLEFDFAAGERKSINAVGVTLVARARICREDLAKSLELVGRKGALNFLGDDDLKVFSVGVGSACGKAAPGVGMGVGVCEIRFYIVDWGAVHEVGALNDKHGAVRGFVINGQKLD